ncbi:FosX/FosE/FosI family fosfomycin resistance thiol transferase [Leucobacter coleopterorum]|uniref:FosX/FosE/FosI family fosfomycin resistance thiol transferase n=1 Tax=Leucobacter coleopterorum TaxID=2714933 RepID=A0ABX6JUS3_9MICO|nr:FosX/FosE/FosI family fosfomycin resistance hydrolase [Leucobacter coleopterorum]QIM18043.1 FosX/FosE/FosI family fosfomycin resistance thiol transferase [Leucobacter coleopterorum]
MNETKRQGQSLASSGLSHITFVVKDLDRMEQILTRVLGAVRVYDSGVETFSISKERFFLIGEGPSATWVATMQGDGSLPASYNHAAFQVHEAALSQLREVISSLGLEIRPPRTRIDGEGQSLYFYDEDNHLFELHTGTLRDRLLTYEARPA